MRVKSKAFFFVPTDKKCRDYEWRKKFEVVFFFFKTPVCVLSAMDCSLPGFSLHGILQAKILKWVAMPYSRGSS